MEELKITYKDYCTIPDNGKKYEVIDGELYNAPAPTTRHQRMLANLWRILDEWVRRNKLGQVFFAPCDVILSDIDIVQPDILYISNAKRNIVTEENIQGPPDLVVEIISQYTEQKDKKIKKKLYSKFGIKEYWVIDPNTETLELNVLKRKHYQVIGNYKKDDKFQSLTFSGLEIKLVEVFP